MKSALFLRSSSRVQHPHFESIESCHIIQFTETWKADVSQDDLMYYYQSVIRPVLEYVCPCWHLSLTKEQTKQLEDVQRRVSSRSSLVI